MLNVLLSRLGRAPVLVVLLVSAPLLAACDDDDEPAGPAETVEVTVMTRNVYLGGNIFRLADASSFEEIPIIAGELFGTVVATNFPERAEALAAEIAATEPHLIGLQEIELYRVQETSDFSPFNPTPNAEDVRYDFLQLLLDELDELGLDYRTVARVQNADAELPAILDISNPTALSDVRLTDFDVILARADVQTSSVVEQNFTATRILGVGGAPVPFPRGYTKVNATVDGAEFSFVNTHMEGSTPENGEQAEELLDDTDGFTMPVILVGDLNTGEGTTTAGYDVLVSSGPFTDIATESTAAAGFTCCWEETLIETDPALLDERIDLILFRGDVEVVSAEIVGDELDDRTPSGLWPSDHAGVVATLRVSQD